MFSFMMSTVYALTHSYKLYVESMYSYFFVFLSSAMIRCWFGNRWFDSSNGKRNKSALSVEHGEKDSPVKLCELK